MDNIVKQVNIEALKSHIPGILPYIPYGGNAFTTNPNGNWGGFPINFYEEFNGTIKVIDRVLKNPGDTPFFINDTNYMNNDLGCAMCRHDYVQLYVFICGEWNKFSGYKKNCYKIGDNEFAVWNDELKKWELDEKEQEQNKIIYEPYLSIISRFHKFQSIINRGIKVKQIRKDSNKYTPRFEGDFVINDNNIISIEDFFVNDNFLYEVKKGFSYNSEYYLLISQTDYEDYCKLGGFTEYEKISKLLGIVIVDNTIKGDLVPNLVYISTIKAYIDELERYKSGDCCNRRKYEMMGGDRMLEFLKEQKYEPLDCEEKTEYFYLPISEEIYEANVANNKLIKYFTGKTSSDRESKELSAWAKMNNYVNNIDGEITEESSDYLNAIVQTYNGTGKLVFEYNYFFKKSWRSPLMPTINVPLILTQNEDDLGVLSVYENENIAQTEYFSKDGNWGRKPYFPCNDDDNFQWELAKTKRINYSNGQAWKEDCWYGWGNPEEIETYKIESKLNQLRTNEKKFDNNGELLPYITKNGKNIPPFKELETFNDVYLYSYKDEDGTEKHVYSCDYIPKGGININGDEITFNYIIGAEYIIEGEPVVQSSIKVYDEEKEMLVHKREVNNEFNIFNLCVDSTNPWSVTIIEEGEMFLELCDANGNIIKPNGTIRIDTFIGSVLLRVVANTDWNIGVEKCTVSPRSGNGETEVLVKIIDMFTGGETLTITYGDKNQYKNTYYLNSVSDKSIIVRDETLALVKTIEAGPNGGNITLIIDNNTSWTIGTSGKWSDAYLVNGEHTYENSSGQRINIGIILHIDENLQPIERNENLIVTSGAYIFQIPIKQNSANYVSVYDLNKSKDEPTNYLTLNSEVPINELKLWVETNVSSGWTLDHTYENESPYLYVSSTYFEFDNAPHSENLTILTNTDYIVIDIEYENGDDENYDMSDTWCNLTQEGVLTVTSNHDNEDRYCTIHVYGKTMNKEDVEYEIQITQKA